MMLRVGFCWALLFWVGTILVSAQTPAVPFSEQWRILTLFKTEKIIPYDSAFLATTEALVAEYEALKARQANPGK